MRAAIPCLLAVMAAGPAAAEAMKIGDLGAVVSRRDCMVQARATLDRYLDDHGGLSVTGEPDAPDAWAVHGWAMRPGRNDIAIICPVVAGNPNAFYVVHASGEEAVADAEAAAASLREIWESLR